jgi:hypothetical protein
MTERTHTVGETRETDRIDVRGDEGVVTVRKLVSKGERLEIDRGDTSVKLDALLLEGLTWQEDGAAVDTLLDAEAAVAGDPVEFTAGGRDGAEAFEPTDDAISVSNEYANVFVREVSTAAGDAIGVTTPGRGTAVTLGPQSLRALAGVDDTSVFSVWFKTPFGPEDTPVEGPL